MAIQYYVSSPPPRSPRARKAMRRIEDALDDERSRPLAEAALHLAVQALQGADDAGADHDRPSTPAKAALARFGLHAAEPMAGEAMLRSAPVIEGVARRAAMIAAAVPLAQAAAQLGVSTSRLRQRIKEGSLMAVGRPRGRGWLIPTFQLTEDGELPHLAPVLRAATRRLSAEALGRAFETPDGETNGMTPRDWLLAGGDPAPVQRIVAGL